MNPSGTTIYLAISLLLGVAQIVDAVVLWRANGQLNRFVIAISKLETTWAIVSAFAWTEIDLPKWVPLSFTAYFASFFLLGLVLRKRVEARGVPMGIILAGGVFGIYFLATSCAFLVSKPA